MYSIRVNEFQQCFRICFLAVISLYLILDLDNAHHCGTVTDRALLCRIYIIRSLRTWNCSRLLCHSWAYKMAPKELMSTLQIFFVLVYVNFLVFLLSIFLISMFVLWPVANACFLGESQLSLVLSTCHMLTIFNNACSILTNPYR